MALRTNSLSQLVLLGVIFLMAPFAMLGLTRFRYDPLDARQEALASSNLKVIAAEPHPSAPPRVKQAEAAVSEGAAGLPPVLPREESLWTPEIDLDELGKADLDAIDGDKRELYSLYKQPTTDFMDRAEAKLQHHDAALRQALDGIDDPGQRITMVTCLFDLGRDKLVGFKRGFDEYIQRFNRIIRLGFPMVIFMEADKVSSMDWSRNRHVVIIPFEIEDLVAHYPNYFKRIEEIRFSKLYKRQAEYTGWLAQSPQASLQHYNLMVMTKMFLLRYGAELNPFHTQYHMFLDAGHLCGPILQTGRLNLLRKHMGRMMVTFFDYGAGLGGESHGMPQKAYRTYVGPPYDDPKTWADKWCCRIVRGGIFGGTRAYIEAAADAYNEVLAQTLADGYMGTEENILGATYYRFPQLFNAFKNEGGDNCAIMSACRRNGDDKDDGGIYTHDSDTDNEWHGWDGYDPEERIITTNT